MTATHHRAAPSKTHDRQVAGRPASGREEKIDKQMEDSFPASDPPSYSGGNHTVGAPVNRFSETPPNQEGRMADEKNGKGIRPRKH
jgi:hypothetical protein